MPRPTNDINCPNAFNKNLSPSATSGDTNPAQRRVIARNPIRFEFHLSFLFLMRLTSLLSFFLLAALALAGCFPTKSTTTPKPRKKTSVSSTEGIRFRYSIVDDAAQFVGVPYQYAGRDPKTGFDCSGFTHYVLDRHGIEVSPASSAQGKEGEKIDIEDVLPGDLIFFGLDGKISHVGMVYQRTKTGIECVHSTTSRGVVIENIETSTYWKPRIMFARDVIGQHKK